MVSLTSFQFQELPTTLRTRGPSASSSKAKYHYYHPLEALRLSLAPSSHVAKVRERGRSGGGAWLQSHARATWIRGRPRRRQTSAQGSTAAGGNPSATQLQPAGDWSQVTDGFDIVAVGLGGRPTGKGISPHVGRALVCFVSDSRWAAPARGCQGCAFSIEWLKFLEVLFSALLGSTEHTSDAAGNWIGSRSQQFAEHGVLCTKTHYGTQGCHSGTRPAVVGVVGIRAEGAEWGPRRGRPAWGR